jgi:3-oxoacyl-[acyl-carrier protein] reductase
MNLTGKVAVVTGASKGIGREIARVFAAAGASVVVNYATSREGADEVVDAITASGGRARAVQGDVSHGADLERVFRETSETFGKLDVLVNNAGRFKFASLEDITEDEFHRQFNTNVLGVILATQQAARLMTGGGSIINMSSIASRSPSLNGTVYSATKAALDSITVSLSKELGPRGIRVNSINPGMVETEGFASLGEGTREWVEQAIKATPLGRVAQPIDVARVALFLASDESAWISGESLFATGGRR